MIFSKKYLLILFIIFILVFGFLGYTTLFGEGDKVLRQNDLQEYISTYLETYKHIIEPPSNLTEKEIEPFKFYKGYPYSAFGVISRSHGVAIQFIPKSSEPYRINDTNENIEDVLFPRMPDNAPDMWTTGLSFVNGAMGYASNFNSIDIGLFIGKNSTFIFDGVSIISDVSIFRKGDIKLDGILLDNKLNIIAKGSNLKKEWSKKKAEQDAKDAFFRELGFVIIEESKLKGLGTIEITSQIENYREKEKKGIYENNLNEKIKDREIIFDTADKYGIHYDSFEKILTDTNDDSISARIWIAIERVGNLYTISSILLILFVIIIIFKNKIKFNKPICQSLKDKIKNIEIINRITKEIKKK